MAFLRSFANKWGKKKCENVKKVCSLGRIFKKKKYHGTFSCWWIWSRTKSKTDDEVHTEDEDRLKEQRRKWDRAASTCSSWSKWMPLSFCLPWFTGWAGWVAMQPWQKQSKYFQDFCRIYVTEKHLEKWWDLYLIPNA